MIDPFFLIILILVSCCIINVLPRNNYPVRYFASVVPGFLILLFAAWQALALAVISLLLFSCLFFICRNSKNKNIKNYLPYIGLSTLFIPDYFNAILEGKLLFIGSAFFIIRQFVTVKESVKEKVEAQDFFISMGLASFFFASLFTGPVFSGLDIHRQLSSKQDAQNGLGFFKLLEGIVFVIPVSQIIIFMQTKLGAIASSKSLLIFLDITAQPILAFAFVFSTFFGYSKIAEGTAHLFGFRVPENFNQPHKSASFSDFWQRWHRSMADFVMKYLYLPISINFKNPKLGLIVAFVFMGLWHNLSVGYLIWGLAHGFALIWLQPKLAAGKIPKVLCRLITLTYVVYISYIANGNWI